MKRVYVNEEWRLGRHLCEYNGAFANSGFSDMANALKGKKFFPRISVDGKDKISTSLIREQTPLETVDFDLLKENASFMAFSYESRRKKFGGMV